MAWDGYFPWAFCLSLSLHALDHHTLTCKYNGDVVFCCNRLHGAFYGFIIVSSHLATRLAIRLQNPSQLSYMTCMDT